MSQSDKRRQCPAVNRSISRAECGEHRITRYACPVDCPFHPFGTARYDELLDLQTRLFKAALERLRDEAIDPFAYHRDLNQLMNDPTDHGAPAWMNWRLLFQRDADGQTAMERWQKDGFPGIKRDEIKLLQAQGQARLHLLEIRRILDTHLVEAVDLLAPEPRPLRLLDEEIAATATRFSTYLAHLYPLSQVHRVLGTAIGFPDVAQFEPTEILSQIVSHLGGPEDQEARQTWLAEHFNRFSEALSAVALARQETIIQSLEAEFIMTTYRLRRPASECLALLDQHPQVSADAVSDLDRKDGFMEARAWLKDKPDATPESKGTRPVLGRVLFSPDACALVAMGQRQPGQFRQTVEAVLGDRIEFDGEVTDDVASALQQRMPEFDRSLVPPGLLANADKVGLSTHRIPIPPGAGSVEDTQAQAFREMDQQFLNEPVPALDNRTPRQAAQDPSLRPRLLRLLKQRVRQHDERNLESGRSDDINWMLQELGTTEILVEPPPWRTPIRRNEWEAAEPETEVWEEAEFEPDSVWSRIVEPEPGRPPAPALPAAPLSMEASAERLNQSLELFDTAQEALEELDRSGATIVADLAELTDELLDESQFSCFTVFLIVQWFSLVPLGVRAPQIDIDRLAERFHHELCAIRKAIEDSTEGISACIADSAQPSFVRALFIYVIGEVKGGPLNNLLAGTSLAVTLCLLKAVTEELDHHLRPAHA